MLVTMDKIIAISLYLFLITMVIVSFFVNNHFLSTLLRCISLIGFIFIIKKLNYTEPD
jgi:hypothetical protein